MSAEGGRYHLPDSFALGMSAKAASTIEPG